MIDETQLAEWERLAKETTCSNIAFENIFTEDAEFYFASRTAVPILCAEVRELRAEVERLHASLDWGNEEMTRLISENADLQMRKR